MDEDTKISALAKARKKRTVLQGPAQFSDRSASTSADMVYLHLKRQIISLSLAPGTLIVEKDIAAAEGVSRTPVREAILRLAKDRLVEVIPKSGTYVSRISVSALPEALLARNALEAVTVRSACLRATSSQLLYLREKVAEQSELAKARDAEGFDRLDEDFHFTIAQIGGLPGLWGLISTVKIHMDRYRKLTLPAEGRMKEVVQEHGAILTALEARDPAMAVAAMGNHLGRLHGDIMHFLSIYPSYFVKEDHMPAIDFDTTSLLLGSAKLNP